MTVTAAKTEKRSSHKWKKGEDLNKSKSKYDTALTETDMRQEGFLILFFWQLS